MIKHYVKLQRETHNNIVYQAWLTALLQRSKKLPSLKKLLYKEEDVNDRTTNIINIEDKRKELDKIKKEFGVI